MCRRKSSAMQSIETMCASQNFDASQLQAKAKLLLSSYRCVCWSALGTCQLGNEDSFYLSDEDIEKAIDYLNGFSPTEPKDVFERNLKRLFDTRWMVELVDSAMIQVKEFPATGEEYFEILSKFFLGKFKYSEADLLDVLRMERSRYYDRKKEAVLIFGLALWGTVLPKVKIIIDEEPILDFTECPD